MLLSLLNDPLVFVFVAAALLISLTIHEFAHAWTADRLGDPTPRHQGRVTLNPLAHLDPVGTLALLLVGFGWGKPVVFDPYNLKNPVRDAALVALAGPASNLILATLLAVVVRAGLVEVPGAWFSSFAYLTIFLNVMLAIFNLVPVYPLDGEKILLALLPKQAAYEFEAFMQRYGTFLLLVLIFPWSGRSLVSQFISPIIELIVGLLLGT